MNPENDKKNICNGQGFDKTEINPVSLQNLNIKAAWWWVVVVVALLCNRIASHSLVLSFPENNKSTISSFYDFPTFSSNSSPRQSPKPVTRKTSTTKQQSTKGLKRLIDQI